MKKKPYDKQKVLDRIGKLNVAEVFERPSAKEFITFMKVKDRIIMITNNPEATLEK